MSISSITSFLLVHDCILRHIVKDRNSPILCELNFWEEQYLRSLPEFLVVDLPFSYSSDIEKMKRLRNFSLIVLLELLLFYLLAQAIDPFEGDLLREKCAKGRLITGCKGTLLDAYKKLNISESDNTVNDPDTYVMLFTRKNKKNPEYIDDCGGELPTNTNFNPKQKSQFIVHGFMESPCLSAWQFEIKDQLLYRDDYNVFIIDWNWGNMVDYYNALNNVPIVAKQIAFVIQNIMKQKNIDANNFHLVGHSLGAQIVGIAGLYVERLTNQKVRRITGLDPAGPGYQTATLDGRLDKSDAQLVDVIHTNGGDCLPLHLGYFEPMGHADFYPNGGKEQLSCLSDILPSYLKGDIYSATSCLLLPTCFHKQSVQYYKASINACSCQFIGVACDDYAAYESGKCSRSCGTDGTNCAIMGMDWEDHYMKEGNHSYFLDTTMSCPYCDNKAIKTEGFQTKTKYSCFSETSSLLPIIG